MRTIAPNTTCANPRMSARYPSFLTVDISGGGVRSMRVHLHGHAALMLHFLPRRAEKNSERHRRNYRPCDLAGPRRRWNQAGFLDASRDICRTQDRNFRDHAGERGGPEDSVSQRLIHLSEVEREDGGAEAVACTKATR